MKDPFDLIPPLSWNNPDDASMLRYLEKTRGVEMAELATLPQADYLREIYELMEINNPPDKPDTTPYDKE